MFRLLKLHCSICKTMPRALELSLAADRSTSQGEFDDLATNAWSLLGSRVFRRPRKNSVLRCMIEKHQPKASEILYLRRLPGRVTSEQAAQLLGMQPHHLPILSRHGLLRPLGGAPRNCVKYYASLEIEQLCTD